MNEFWKVAVGIVGVGAVGAFVFWSLYKDWLKLPALENKLTKKQIFILFLIFLILTFLFGVASLATYVMAHSPAVNGPALVIGPVTQNHGSIDNETLKKVLDASTGFAKEALSAKDQEIEQLKAALERTHIQANKGDIEAKAALEEARRSGDTSKLQVVLIHEADRMLAIHGVTEEYILLCREIATVAFLRGNVDEAHFRVQTVLHAKPNDLSAMNLLGRIHDLRGQFDDAKLCYEKILELAEKDESWKAAAYGNLGRIYQMRGELDLAEEMHRKSLAIHNKLGHQEGLAEQYGNLGLIHETRSDLDSAEELYRKALAIDEKLGSQDGMGREYGRLGVLYRTRGDLDSAEEMLRKSLAIHENLGHQVGIATDIGNLGIVYWKRGELNPWTQGELELYRAEEMLKKSLALHEKLGNQKGMANQYGNLGVIYLQRGELDQAEEMYRKVLAIEEKLGRLESIANAHANLGLVYVRRRDVERAEEMFRKALAAFEKLGQQENMAHSYTNLGLIAENRGELERARELWTKARDLHAKIGMPHMVKKVQGLLDRLPPEEAAG